MKNLKQELIRELKIWLWYALISSIATMFSYDWFIEQYQHSDAEYNPVGMFGKLAERTLVPFLCVFAMLSAIRIGFVCIRSMLRRESN